MKQIELPFKVNFKVGDKVKIIGKSVRWAAKYSKTYKQGYGYIHKISHGNIMTVGVKKFIGGRYISGGYFLEKDLERMRE